ncbi:hypothetical protein MNAN1_003306 [Malassezia nana]|uniref:Rab-GAP TBC domain-containing protein n=1 Tax=Malassezia nana TaxID=180528 RepID=A0AAF0J4Q2_9BASI|nr:hypothetical protein MNAN1_003306 [Malassezia nana]
MSVVTLEEFLEILNEEQHLDLAKLRNYARHGVHPQVRGEVWLYLLGVLSADKSQEMTAVRSKFLEYESVSKHIPLLEKQIRTEYGLATMRSNLTLEDSEVIDGQRKMAQSVENVLCAYLNRHLVSSKKPDVPGSYAYAAKQATIKSQANAEYPWGPSTVATKEANEAVSLAEFHPSLVYLYDGLISEEYNISHPLPQRVSLFMTLFRTSLPELHAYFETEEVDVLAVATSWLQHLLAREMQMDDLMRLWGTFFYIFYLTKDTYFAVPDLLDLHLYVCLAILMNCKDALEDLDRSETMSMLCSLPPLDVDRVRTQTLTQIISDAVNIRLSLEHDGLYE